MPRREAYEGLPSKGKKQIQPETQSLEQRLAKENSNLQTMLVQSRSTEQSLRRDNTELQQNAIQKDGSMTALQSELQDLQRSLAQQTRLRMGLHCTDKMTRLNGTALH